MSGLLDALGYVGDTLDKPGRAVRGLLAGNAQEGLAALPFSDSLGLTDPSQAVSGSALLQQLVGLDAESTLGQVGGFGAEVLLDPTNLIGGLGIARRGLTTAARAGEAVTSNVRRAELVARGAMPAEVAALTTVREGGEPLRTLHGTQIAYDTFDPAKVDDANALLYGPGYYTTNKPEIAASYAVRENNPVLAERFPLETQAANMRDSLAYNRRQLDNQNPLLWGDETVESYRAAAARRAAAAEAELAAIEARLAAVPLPTPNTRMQYLDIRNPLDMDAKFEAADADAMLTKLFGPYTNRAGIAGASRFYPNQLVPGQQLWDSFLKTGGVPSSAAPVDKARGVELLKQLGFDGITHVGGVHGGPPHRVHIAFDPAQIYKPWLAPAEQAVPSVRGAVSPLLAALGGHNLAARGLSQ